MSYCDCIACRHELPAGDFCVPHIAVYDSYRAFMSSEHYIPLERRTASLSADAQRRALEERALSCMGKVVVQRSYGAPTAALHPFGENLPFADPDSLRAMEADAASHLTLPFKYHFDLNLDYLYKYLLPGEQIEIYCAWAGAPASLTVGEPDHLYIDLQDIADGRLDPDENLFRDSHHLIHLTAARSIPHPIDLAPNPVPRPLALVYLDLQAIFVRTPGGYLQI